MKNFKVALLAAAVTASVVNSDVNADCLGSGIQIGVGFKASKSKFEIQNNKVKPYNERLIEKVASRFAPLQAKHEQIFGYSADGRTLFYGDGSVSKNAVTVDRETEFELSGYRVNDAGNDGVEDTSRHAPNVVRYRNMYLYSREEGDNTLIAGIKYNTCDVPGIPVNSTTGRTVNMLPISDGGMSNYVKPLGSAGRCDWAIDVLDNGEVMIRSRNADGGLVANSYSYRLEDVADYFLRDFDDFASRGNIGVYTTIEQYFNELGTSSEDLSLIDTIRGLGGLDDLSEIRPHGMRIDGNTSEWVNLRQNYITGIINKVSEKINASNAAFAKSGIGQNYEKADHWDGAFDITLGWHQRFGDFALYFGGVAEIPCFKKEYQIKDKALASLKSNTSNSDNNNKSSSDENNEYGYTFKKTPSFAVSIMGFYNVTKMCSIGAGVNIWKQRGELNYNKTGELYLLSEGSDLTKYVTAFDKTSNAINNFNAEAKKAGYDKKTEKVSAWMFEPTVAFNFNWGNFMMSLRGGYKIGKKFIKAGDGKFDLKGSGFNIGVNLSYTIPVI